jgi:DNA-binding winged helix-turn-helix (wHTH) protein
MPVLVDTNILVRAVQRNHPLMRTARRALRSLVQNGEELCVACQNIADSIVRAHGGSVRVSSRPGAGSTFSLCLPGLRSFRIGELIARVNAFLRRAKAKQLEIFRFGDFELNLAAHKLFRGAGEIELTPREFRLLAYMVSRRGCALARNDILNNVWGHSIVVTPRSIDRCVATLRAKIEPDLERPAYIQTIRDIGYRFESGRE